MQTSNVVLSYETDCMVPSVRSNKVIIFVSIIYTNYTAYLHRVSTIYNTYTADQGHHTGGLQGAGDSLHHRNTLALAARGGPSTSVVQLICMKSCIIKFRTFVRIYNKFMRIHDNFITSLRIK